MHAMQPSQLEVRQDLAAVLTISFATLQLSCRTHIKRGQQSLATLCATSWPRGSNGRVEIFKAPWRIHHASWLLTESHSPVYSVLRQPRGSPSQSRMTHEQSTTVGCCGKRSKERCDAKSSKERGGRRLDEICSGALSHRMRHRWRKFCRFAARVGFPRMEECGT